MFFQGRVGGSLLLRGTDPWQFGSEASCSSVQPSQRLRQGSVGVSVVEGESLTATVLE